MDAVKLLPCPFCGGNNISWKWNQCYSLDSSYATFGCQECGANFDADNDSGVSPEDVAAWNTRTAAHPVTVEMLESWLGQCQLYNMAENDFLPQQIRAAIAQMKEPT